MVFAEGWRHILMEQNKEPRNRLKTIFLTIFDKKENGGRVAFLNRFSWSNWTSIVFFFFFLRTLAQILYLKKNHGLNVKLYNFRDVQYLRPSESP